MTDVIIIGGGPAGVSAALTAMHRGKTALIVSSPPEDSPLWKAEHIDNYPGLPGVTGRELLQKLLLHAEGSGAKIMRGRVLSVLPMGGAFGVSVGSDFVQGRAVVIASGLSRAKPYPGEAEFLGAGVSYCATCDGMLYRGKAVLVWGLSPEAAGEANFLASIGCRVRFVAAKRPETLDAAIEFLPGSLQGVGGGMKLEWARVAGQQHAADGVFILRAAIAPDTLLPGLSLANGFVTVNRSMATNLPGVFAAGDVTGAPLQVAKAVGEGLIAGLSAADYLSASGA